MILCGRFVSNAIAEKPGLSLYYDDLCHYHDVFDAAESSDRKKYRRYP